MAASGRRPPPHPDQLVENLNPYKEQPIPTGTLSLNGTAIDYDDRGDGPPLLLLPGGVGHAGFLDGFASHLADRYRVVAMSSRVASAPQADRVQVDQHPKIHAEDTVGLIKALFNEPPAVFAFSSGAITTLELLAHHPEHVRLAVVHEPPVVGLLPEAERHIAALESVRTAARTDMDEASRIMIAAMTTRESDGDTPELRHLGSWLDGYADTAPEPPTPELVELFTRLGDLQSTFIEHVVVPFTTGEVDLDALGAAGSRLVPVAGIDSRGQLPYRAAATLAVRLGLPLTEFPGGHLGPVERPTQVANALKTLLEQH